MKLFPSILLILAFLALLIGANFYYDQLSATPIWLWLFVPVCPLYAFLMCLVLLFSFPRNEILRFVISSASAVYGAWTIFILFFHFADYFSAGNFLMSIILVLGHAGMVAGAFLILPKKKNIIFPAAAILWLGINTFLWFGIGKLSAHPWIPLQGIDFVQKVTWALAIFFPFLLYLAIGWAGKNTNLEKIRKLLAF